MKIEVVKLQEGAKLPIRGTLFSAGWDLHSVEKIMIDPQTMARVKTGLAVAVPEGFELQIRPRSGLSFKHQIIILNSPGTIDSDYRGEIMVLLYNLGASPVPIEIGDRIAQAVLNKYEEISFELVESLSETERGQGSFGHTGK